MLKKNACVVCGKSLGRWYVPHCFACNEPKCTWCACTCGERREERARFVEDLQRIRARSEELAA